MPYATLQGLMTTNQYERGLLGNLRMLQDAITYGQWKTCVQATGMTLGEYRRKYQRRDG